MHTFQLIILVVLSASTAVARAQLQRDRHPSISHRRLESNLISRDSISLHDLRRSEFVHHVIVRQIIRQILEQNGLSPETAASETQERLQEFLDTGESTDQPIKDRIRNWMNDLRKRQAETTQSSNAHQGSDVQMDTQLLETLLDDLPDELLRSESNDVSTEFLENADKTNTRRFLERLESVGRTLRNNDSETPPVNEHLRRPDSNPENNSTASSLRERTPSTARSKAIGRRGPPDQLMRQPVGPRTDSNRVSAGSAVVSEPNSVSNKVLSALIEAVDKSGTELLNPTQDPKKWQDWSWLAKSTSSLSQHFSHLNRSANQTSRTLVDWLPQSQTRYASPMPEDSFNLRELSTRGFALISLLVLAAFFFAHLVLQRRSQENVLELDAFRSRGPLPATHIRDRESLVRACDSLAVTRLGPRSSFWNHQKIFDKLVRRSRHGREAAARLAELYQFARYAPGDLPISRDQVDAARRIYGTLANLRRGNG